MTERKRILIVEDSEEGIVFLSEILESYGYPYDVARDGKEALAAMRNSRPDLVLLDVMMPRRSGIAVLKEMKRDAALRTVPVIVVTGAPEVTGVDFASGAERPKQSEEDAFFRGFGVALHEQLEELKPDGLVEKPIDPERLVEKIRALIG